MTAPDCGGSTGCDDRPTFSCGGSLFNSSGQRLNEIDLDAYEAPKPMADMTDEDWQQAAEALRAFERERGIR